MPIRNTSVIVRGPSVADRARIDLVPGGIYRWPGPVPGVNPSTWPGNADVGRVIAAGRAGVPVVDVGWPTNHYRRRPACLA